MHDVGLRVPIVPVVTKADTMTIREAGIYRSEVANKIANPMLPGEHIWINQPGGEINLIVIKPNPKSKKRCLIQ